LNTEEERRRKKREEERKKQAQRQAMEQLQRRKHRSLHDKHNERRKKDCILGMPFIVAFQGDPSKTFYCADHPETFELIPRTGRFPKYERPLARLARYLDHHVTQIHAKVLIYKAAENDSIWTQIKKFIVSIYRAFTGQVD
jgi:hypothetical protein